MERHPTRRLDPDPAGAAQRQYAVRPHSAVRRPRLWASDRARHHLVARFGKQLLGPQRHHPGAGLCRAGRPAAPAGQEAVRRPYPQPRFHRGGADAPRRLGHPHGAEPGRLLRRMPTHHKRLRRARPALVSGQPTACRRGVGAWPALDVALTSGHRHRHLCDGAAVARLPLGRHYDLIAGAVHPAGILPLRRDAISAMAGAGPGARGLRLRRHHGASGAAEIPWLSRHAAAPERAPRHGRRLARLCQRAVRDPGVGADRADHDVDAMPRGGGNPVRIGCRLVGTAARRRLAAARRADPAIRHADRARRPAGGSAPMRSRGRCWFGCFRWCSG